MTTPAPATLISVDWGTTSLRCALVDSDGRVLQSARSEQGILKTGGQPFSAVLSAQVEPWLARFADGVRVPILLSGMIGSRQGWQEAGYLRCPASPDDLAKNLLSVDVAGTGLARCDVRIVPGMDTVGRNGLPDVMRGEETQVLGALAGAGLQSGVFVLPGTHSKWVVVKDRTITDFQTYMTGEIYAALLDATILGRLVAGDDHHGDSFKSGLAAAVAADEGTRGRRSSPGDLLNIVFSARSRVLSGELAETGVRSYLSGLLIGAEMMSGIRAATTVFEGDDAAGVVHVLADEPLMSRYTEAAAFAGIGSESAADNPVAIAHLVIAQLAGIVS